MVSSEYILGGSQWLRALQVHNLQILLYLMHIFTCCRYSTELLEKVKQMADGIVVEDAPVFKTRDEIMKSQQVCS